MPPRVKAPKGQDQAERLLLEILRDFARDSGVARPPEGITLDTRLEVDLGLDSLGRAELAERVGRGLGMRLPDEAVLAATGRDLLALAASARAAGSGPAASEGPAGRSGPAPAGDPAGAASLVEVLDWHVARHPSQVHIHSYGPDDRAQPITYADLAGAAGRIAAGLQGLGVRPGSAVALMLPTGPDYFFYFFGILAAGGIPVPIYPPARPRQVEDHLRRHARILDNAGALYLVTLPQGRTVARLLKAQVPCLKGVLTPEDLLHAPSGSAGAPPDASAAGGAIALLQYTSGSTGDPKGVILTHADLLANIRAMGEAAQVTPGDCFVSWLPLYHDMGLIGAWLGSLYYGIPLVSLSPLAFLARPLRWLKAIHDHRGTLSAAPNFAYELCLKRIGDQDLAGLDLRSWRRAFNGAEPVSPQTLRRFAERFAPCGLSPDALAPVYGLAEAGVGLAFPPPGRGPRIDCIDRSRFAATGHALAVPCDDPLAMPVVGCGYPLPGYRVRVVDAAGNVLPERHEGLLQFQGPSATQGYYRNPAATERLIRDGWHDTGDRAYLAGGEIHLTGRVKDLIIRGGRNLYPYELEQAVGELPGIRKGCVAAFAAADPASGSERLVLVAETRQRDPRRRSALERAVRERAADLLDLPPDEVLLAPPGAVLKTSSGKVQRAATRERYLAGKLFAEPAQPLWQLVRVGASGVLAMALRAVRAVPAWLYAGYAWVLFGSLAPLVWLGVVLLPRRDWRWALVRGGIRVLRRAAGVPLEVRGREHIPAPGRAFVVASNHQSYLDAMVLAETLRRPIAFVAKRELKSNPLARIALERLGTLFVERFDAQRSAEDGARLPAALGPGEVVGFFPEGTFRDQPGLLDFRMGAFLAAAGAGVPVLPLALRGTRALMAGSGLFPRPGRISVAIGEPLEPAGRDWEAAVGLRRATRAFILAHCDEPDAGGRSDPVPGR